MDGMDEKEPGGNGQDGWNDVNRRTKGASSPVTC
jgi:hypothetical protein